MLPRDGPVVHSLPDKLYKTRVWKKRNSFEIDAVKVLNKNTPGV